MENEKKQHDICKPGIDCSYTISRGKMTCNHKGSPDYLLAELLEAHTSAFHNDEMVEATKSINRILSEIPKDNEGRTLSFIQTRMGIMLAWIEKENESLRTTDKEDDEGDVGVTSADDNDTLAKALNLKNYKSN